MRQFTNLLLVLLFLATSVLYAQQNSAGLTGQALDQYKIEMMNQPVSERAPGTQAGNEVIPSDADFDLQFEFACGDASGEAGVETDGNYIYTTKWNGAGFFKYELNGTFLGAFQVGAVSGIRDLAYDGTYFYGGAAATTVFKMDFNTNTLIGQFTAPVAVRAIGYDEGEDGFWANNWSTTLTLFDQSGAVLNTITTVGDESFYGLAYDPQGPYLWGHSQRTGSSQNLLYKYDLSTGTKILEFDVFPLLSLVVTGDIAGGLAFHPNLVTGFYSIVGIAQNKCIWGLEMGLTGPPAGVDVGIQSIVSPNSGVSLGTEQVVIKIKNYGSTPQSNIPWTITWSGQGSGSFNGTYAGPLAAGAEVDITAGTANLAAFGTYNFEACTNLAGDENPGNNCKTKAVVNAEPSLCVDNLYTSGCSFGDGLTSWSLENITVASIPCAGTPPWYQNYMDQIHDLTPGQTYVLSLTAGYADTYVDVWIDFDGNLELNNTNELVLNDAICAVANTVYTFNITIPADAPEGTYVLRARTNWTAAVADPCATYSYGNCVDFKAQIGEGGGPAGPPPVNLAANLSGNDAVLLTWQAPEEPGMWLQWCDDMNNDGLGLTDGGTFIVAARWVPADLTAYNGQHLTKVALYPRSDLGATFTLKVYKGANAGTMLISQPLTSLVMDEWNEIMLTTPVVVDASAELWVGYEITHVGGDYPAGMDAGPAIAGKGDMITLDGGATWSPLSGFGLDYNFNIKAFVADATDATVAQPIAQNSTYNYNSSVLKAGNLRPGLDNSASMRGPDSYNVYRGGNVIANTMGLSYTDAGLAQGTYVYEVTAVYPGGESDPAGPVSIYVPGAGAPGIGFNPTSLVENHTTPNTITTQTLMVMNTGTSALDFSIAVQRSSTAGPDVVVDPEMVAAAYAERYAADGIVLSAAKGVPGGASPNMTDDEVIRYDDGTNADAIGLTSGGTFHVSAYWPASTMGQYAGMKLDAVEIFVYDAPTSMTLKIYGQGTSTVAGPLLHSQPIAAVAQTWVMTDLTSQVDITGQDIWIGYEVTHTGGTFCAGVDPGPAVAGFGDMISLAGGTYESMSISYGLNYNWNIAGYLVPGGPALTNDVGVQAILSPNSGPGLGTESVVVKVKNFGTAAQSNIPWSVSWTGAGSGSLSGTIPGPLAGGAEIDVTAGTANLSAYGTYNFEACTSLAGDENPANNCKTKAVVNAEPTLCVTNLYTSGCSFGDGLTSWSLENITVANIPCAGTPPWYQNYMDQIHELDPGQTYVLTVTAGYADTYFDVWIDFDGNLELNNANELVLNDAVCAVAGTVYTFNITIPADAPEGTWVMRARTNWTAVVTDPCATYSYGNCVDFKAMIGEGGTTAEWLSAQPLAGTVAPGQSFPVQVTFNSTGLANPSVKTGALVFTSNAPGSPHNVPATLNVGGAPPVPVMSLNPTSLTETHFDPPQITTKPITVTNTGGGTLNWDLTINRSSTAGPDVVVDPEFVAQQYIERMGLESGSIERAPGTYPGNEVIPSDADFDLQFEFACGDASGEAGVETDGNYIYTTKWNGAGFFKYELNGTFLGAFQVGAVSAIRDLAYDGTYFYGGAAATTVFKMDFNTNTLIGQFTAPVAVRAIGYDEGEDGFWANNWSTTLTLFDQSGAVLNTITTVGDESFYGLAYDPQGPYLWGYSQRTGSSQNLLYKYDLSTGTKILEFDVFPLLSLVVTGDIAGGLAFHPNLVTGFYSIVGIAQNKCIWGLEMGPTGPPAGVDVGVQSIVSPNSGVELGIEQVIIKIKNHGSTPQSNIPWTITWSGQGSGSFNGTYAGPLAAGAEVDITAGTANLSAFGTYNFEACTNLAGDENPGNNCKTKAVVNAEPSLCVDNLYTSGCSFGDGLTSWSLENITVASIPCAGTPPWYQNYMDQIHELEAGQTYVLSLTAGYADTYVDVWIDFDGNLELNNANELVLNDAICAVAGTVYTFDITIPADAPEGTWVMRARTNWTAVVTGPCDTYSYGNCVDFKAMIGEGGPSDPWLSADKLSGSLGAGQSEVVTVTFNSNGLPVPSIHNGTLVFTSNAAGSPHTVPATLIVDEITGPYLVLNPTSLTETHVDDPTITTKVVNVSNPGTEAMTFDIAIQRSSTAGPDVVVDPEMVAAAYAERYAADGIVLGAAKGVPGGASPNMTDDEVIRYDDGTNADAIGLTSGGTFHVSAYWPASTMGQYAGMKLDAVEIFVYDAPTSMTLNIYGQGTSTVAGPLLHSQPIAAVAQTWVMTDLTSQVDITGQDIWIGYEVTHTGGTFCAGVDPGPAVAGFGDMISLAGGTYESMSISYGLNYNWNIAGYLVPGGPALTNDVGVQAILSPNSGPGLGTESVVVKVKNFGTAAQSNIPWSVSWTGAGSGSLSGTIPGPLAGGAEIDVTAGTANLSAYGTYNFEACTSLAGDENPANNCKTKAVVNAEPTLCVDNLYTSGCSFGDGLTSWSLENITVANIPCAGTPPWYQNYTNLLHDLQAGSTYVLTVTAGYADTYFDVWIDFDGNLELNNTNELVLNDAVCAVAGTVYTFNITIPADAPNGEFVMRARTNWTAVVTDPCATYSYGNCVDFKAEIGGGTTDEWLSADPLTGTVQPGGNMNINVTFNSNGLAFGTYNGSLIFTSNAPSSPDALPCTLHFIEEQTGGLVVNPMELDVTHDNPPQNTQHILVATNTGTTPINYTIDVNRSASLGGPDVVVDPMLVAQRYIERLAIESGSVERAPGTYPGNEIIPTDADYDLQFEFACGDASGEAGVETDGNYIYTTKWNGAGFFKYETNGTFLGAFQVGAVSAIRDLAYDGTYFYGGAAATTVFKMDFNTNTLIGQFTAPVAVRAIGYDEGEGGFWANNWSTTLTLFDESGAVLNTIATNGDESFYGLAYDPQGPYLWGYSQRTGTSQNILYKYALPAGTFIEEFDVFPLLSLVVTGDIAGGLAFHPDLVQGTYSIVGIVQNKCIWGLEMGLTGPPAGVDVGVQSIVSPNSGVELGTEQVVIKIKNHGAAPQSNIPWTITWSGQGSGSFNGTYAGPLAAGAEVDITAGTANLSAFGTYNFEACTNLAGDENPGNNCKTKAVTNSEASLCVDNLYTSGCSFGDGLTSWSLQNITIANIPCAGTPPWYQNYMDQIHTLEAGNTYVLTVTAGYADTYFDVWIDFDGNLELNNANELVLNDGICAVAGTVYTFNITIPANAPSGTFVMRARTNWTAAVTGPCDTYSYGNCVDFKAQVGGGTPTAWLTADPLAGTIAPGQSANITVTLNSTGLEAGIYEGSVVFNSNAINPVVTVPVTLTVIDDCPLPPPTNVALQQTGTNPYNVVLTWDEPEMPGGVIRWDSGQNNGNAIGLTSGGTFSVAARFNPDQLAQYVGLYLTDIDMFSNDPAATFVIKVWTGTTGSTQVVSQPATVTSGQWSTISLTTPVEITANLTLYIGYETTHGAGTFPAGTDDGPAVANFGDLISLSGGAWTSMSVAYGLNYNWNLAGHLGLAADGLPLAEPIQISPTPAPAYGVPTLGQLPKPANGTWANNTRALEGYNIMRDGAVIANIGLTTTYTDVNVPLGLRTYKVGARYTECVSWSEPASLGVFIIERGGDNTISIYPNPATDVVNIESTNIKQVMIINNLGQVVYNKPADNDNVQINTSNLEKGVYIIRIQTGEKTFTEKLIIQ